MPSRSNASDSPSFDRRGVAGDLYLDRGAGDASFRCDVNRRLGDFDLTETLALALRLEPGDTVVDVGCGSGQHLVRYAQCVTPGGAALGFDISPDAVAAARERGVDARVADAATLPIPSSSADAVACAYAIYYHPDLEAVLREWARVLKAGGRLAVCGPAADNNAELYRFHRAATGCDPTDADLMALGYVESSVYEAVARGPFEDVHLEWFTNRVRFPDAAGFLEYWRSTSLFLRTPDARVENGEAELAGHEGPVVVTKRIALVTARRR